MGFQTSTSIQGAVLGFVRVNARMSVRGRRGVQLSPELRLSDEEKIELYKILKLQFEPQLVALQSSNLLLDRPLPQFQILGGPQIRQM
jgi:hypothetical protein